MLAHAARCYLTCKVVALQAIWGALPVVPHVQELPLPSRVSVPEDVSLLGAKGHWGGWRGREAGHPAPHAIGLWGDVGAAGRCCCCCAIPRAGPADAQVLGAAIGGVCNAPWRASWAAGCAAQAHCPGAVGCAIAGLRCLRCEVDVHATGGPKLGAEQGDGAIGHRGGGGRWRWQGRQRGGGGPAAQLVALGVGAQGGGSSVDVHWGARLAVAACRGWGRWGGV